MSPTTAATWARCPGTGAPPWPPCPPRAATSAWAARTAPPGTRGWNLNMIIKIIRDATACIRLTEVLQQAQHGAGATLVDPVVHHRGRPRHCRRWGEEWGGEPSSNLSCIHIFRIQLLATSFIIYLSTCLWWWGALPCLIFYLPRHKQLCFAGIFSFQMQFVCI